MLSVPIIRLSEFFPDIRKIGQGLVAGEGDWQRKLEDNQMAFALEFVSRSRFTFAYPTSLKPAQFVDALNTNAGNVLSSSGRTAAINLFGGASNTSNTTARGQAVRQVAENQNLYNAEYNRAFVLMQYFGYLRRNPDDPPDGDFTGYDSWLRKLNQFNGDFVGAELIKAFITSDEFQKRFAELT